MQTATTETEMNAHLSSFLSDNGFKSMEAFNALARESGKEALHLLTVWAEEQTKEFGPEAESVEWAGKQIDKLRAVAEKKKKVAIVVAAPLPAAEEKPEFTEIPVEAMDESEEIPSRPIEQEEEIVRRITAVIGQEKAVAYLERELRNIEKGQPLPFFGLYDDTGLGKTHLINRFAAALPRSIRFFSLNCKDKLNVTDKQGKDYFAAISEALAEGTPTIIHLDEFGNKNGTGSLQQWIMSHISKAPDGKALGIHGGDPLSFDPCLLGFIVTSFAPEKAAVDIVDRIKQPAELQLTNYSPEEMMQILKLAVHRACRVANVKTPRMSDASLAMVARSMRGNARQSNDVADEIRKRTADNESFSLTLETAADVMRTVGVYPHGLNQGEIKILSALSVGAKNRDTLQQKTGVEKAHWTRAVNYLTEGTGRGTPFQLCNREGEPIKDKCGALIDYERGKYHLTLHGGAIVAILKRDKWID